MEPTSGIDRMGQWAKKSISLKLFTMGFLLVVCLIPSAMIQSTIRERQLTQATAVREIASKWGGSQTLAGPWLTIPYVTYYKDPQGVAHPQTHQAYFLPEDLAVSGDLGTEIRYRGIYEAVLYQASLQVKGRFAVPDFKALNIPAQDVLWDQAVVGFGITDMRGIRSALTLKWNEKDHSLNPGILAGNLSASGVSAHLPLGAPAAAEFALDLKLNGSQNLSVVPLGKTTTVSLRSPWNSPSFTGSFLPADRQMTPQGFQARWHVLHLNRNYPQSWVDQRPEVDTSGFGVELIVPADQYQKTSRSTKYAVLFVLLTFGALFFIEISHGHPVHVLQYLLIGLAIVFFYSLLLSLAEHLGFKAAYGLSSLGIVTMITLYAKGIFRSARITGMVAALMCGLYGYLYTLLQLEDYALLIGNLGLLLALGGAMYLSRRVDWDSR